MILWDSEHLSFWFRFFVAAKIPGLSRLASKYEICSGLVTCLPPYRGRFFAQHFSCSVGSCDSCHCPHPAQYFRKNSVQSKQVLSLCLVVCANLNFVLVLMVDNEICVENS